MKNSMPEELLITLVRHQFYRAIDWERCKTMPIDLQLVEKEFRVVIKHLITHDANELPENVKRRVEEDVIKEFQDFGLEKMSTYMARLEPQLPLWERVFKWLVAPLVETFRMIDDVNPLVPPSLKLRNLAG